MGRERAVWLAVAVWLSAVAGGLWAWERHDATPGAAGDAIAPPAAPGRWTLTVFAHPKCPCARATLIELAELAPAVPELVVRVRIVVPPDPGLGWERGEAWAAAGRVAGADVAADPGGAEARRCGAETSGHAVLTGPDGAVAFRGGLTPGRGRPGPGAGRRAVVDWVSGRAGAPAAPVFGCELFAPGG